MTARFDLETIMRFAVPAVALSLFLATVSSVGYGRARGDDVIDPRSTALAQAGSVDVEAGKFDSAADQFESALLIDPRNRSAYIGLAQIARKQEMPGKAIRLYREALMIDPNDVRALAGQGEAMVQKGALSKAKENLARIERICPVKCVERQKLASVIAKGAPPAPKAVAVEAVKPQPVVQDKPKP